MTDFRLYITTSLEANAARFRQQCRQWTKLWKDLVTGDYDITPMAREIGISTILNVKVPVLERFTGYVSEEDKAWWSQVKKPDYRAIAEEYIETIKNYNNE